MFEERGDANCLLICRGWIGNGIERRYEKDAQNARYIYLGSHYVLRTDYITLFIYSEDQNRLEQKGWRTCNHQVLRKRRNGIQG